MGALTHLVARSLPVLPRFFVGWVARRYVAGEDLEAVVETVRQLNREGAVTTVGLLGEEVKERSAAETAVEEYLRAVKLIRTENLEANLSVKLTLLGLRIDEGLCLENLERLVAAAKKAQNFVRIDMEDHTCIEPTWRIYRQVQERYGNVGVVLQAYLRRILGDIDSLASFGANVRLCKGIYIEPRAVAWQEYETVRHNFVVALEKLLKKGVYVGIATHDEYLVCAALGLIDRLKIGTDGYEFQLLLGVAAPLRQTLLAAGHRVRVYVSYGRDWYPYSLRRLRENPKIVSHVVRTLFSRPQLGV